VPSSSPGDGNGAVPDPEVREPSFGERLKYLRSRRGMTREVLGGLVGKSAEWVKAVENGRLQQPKLHMLLRLAEALRIRELSELTGDQSVPIRIFTGPGHPALPAVRAAINTLAWADGPAEPLDHLQARLDAAWRARHASPDHRTVLGAVLPGLIRDAQRAVSFYEGDDRRRAHALLAETYNLAQFFLAYQPAADLLWRVAERAMGTAREADEPYAIGASVWLLAQAHRDAGEFEAAEEVNRQGLELLRPRMDDASARLRGNWGALLFEAAYTAARAGQRGRAWGYWDQANEVARRLPAAFYDPMTSFSRIIMGAHAMTVAVESREGGESRRQARRTADLPIPSQPRRGRHLIEVARGYHLANDLGAALGTLDSAYKTAPETIRYNGYARKILFELATEGPAELRRDANDLADRVGMLV
jgi:transcriptional regulator with XRE-family HTH domain